MEAPLLTPQKQPVPHQKDKLARWPHETRFPDCGAIEFMRRTIRENPHEVTLLDIGPMTNLALLFAMDSELPPLLKQVVVMCGVFTYGLEAYTCLSEWNARCDPYATAMVYRAPVKKLVSVGLDVTTKVVLQKEDVLRRFTGGLLETVLDFSGIPDNTRDSITFHDPLAAAVIFEPNLCRFERGNVEVELESRKLEGLTSFEPDKAGRHEVAFAVDTAAFFSHYFQITEG